MKKISQAMNTKLDLVKTDRTYYSAAAEPGLVELEPVTCLRISGKGDPSGEDYARRISALYPVAYAIKFMCKDAGKDFTVPKLEGQWWFDEEKFGLPAIHEAPGLVPRSEWEYHTLIRMPGFVDEPMVEQARENAFRKKKEVLIRQVTLITLNEGLVVQAMHTGPFANEPETLQKIKAFTEEHRLEKNGLHHEIYLSDFRKTPPEKLKTILREPVRRAT